MKRTNSQPILALLLPRELLGELPGHELGTLYKPQPILAAVLETLHELLGYELGNLHKPLTLEPGFYLARRTCTCPSRLGAELTLATLLEAVVFEL